MRHVKPKNKTRKRNVTWFNPPLSKNVATNVENKFFTLLSSCFPPNNKLHEIVNKNTLKLSYWCMNNVQQIINSHNKNNTNQCSKRQQQTLQLQRKKLLPPQGQVPSKRSCVPSHRRTKTHQPERHIYRNNRKLI